jgi:hypothetical protein
LFMASMVFSGEVISEEELKDSEGDVVGTFYLMNVIKVYRGRDAKTVEVFTENKSNRMPLKKGWKYLLFAYETIERLSPNRVGGFCIDCCGNSVILKDALPVITKIEESLKEASSRAGGSIRGRVVKWENNGLGVPRIVLDVRGERNTFVVTTDSDGWFEVRVPAGRYVAVPRSVKKMRIVDDSTSRNDPNNIIIVDGGGAEIFFVTLTTP